MGDGPFIFEIQENRRITFMKSRTRAARIGLRVFLFLALTAAMLAKPALFRPAAYASEGNNYYVDSVGGSDKNSGTSEAEAWLSLAQVHSRSFQPGDVIHFKRGSSWTGGLVIDDSGVEGNPIIFKAYGIGARPIITNPGSWDSNRWSSALKIYADWVVVEDLLVRDAHESGVFIADDADYNVIRNIEATEVGTGVIVSGQHNLVTQSYLHDMIMIYNSPGGDDDFGAVGVALYDSNNEISYNTIEDCIAPSYDYGTDGGAIEIFGIVNNNYVHHNWAAWNDGFLEVGGREGEATCHDNVFAHNVSINNNGLFSYIHMAGTSHFGSDVQNLQVYNNTIIENDSKPYSVFSFWGSPSAEGFKLRDNVIYTDRRVSNESGFTHDHNVYYRTDGSTDLGFSLGDGEVIADPLFVDVYAQDYHLQAGSPAIDAGVDLGYALDFEDRPIPAGVAPDAGAYEYQGSGSVDEIIVDDADANFSTSFSQDEWQSYTQVGGEHYGDSHHFNVQMGTGQDTATWSFAVPNPGIYDVYARWWAGAWRPVDVPYTISYHNGTTVVDANQQESGGQWNLLGTFHFENEGSVTVSDDVSTGQDLVADAIRLVYQSEPPLPTPTPSPTSTPTVRDTPTPPPTETPFPTDMPTPSPTSTSTSAPTVPPTDPPTSTPTETPTPTYTPAPSPTSTSTATPMETASPTLTPTVPPTSTPTPSPTSTSTSAPTVPPTDPPTSTPTETSIPTDTPTPMSTETPSPTSTPETGQLTIDEPLYAGGTAVTGNGLPGKIVIVNLLSFVTGPAAGIVDADGRYVVELSAILQERGMDGLEAGQIVQAMMDRQIYQTVVQPPGERGAMRVFLPAISKQEGQAYQSSAQPPIERSILRVFLPIISKEDKQTRQVGVPPPIEQDISRVFLPVISKEN
jgi:hypothetical protein